jgi:hypothetical protein
MSKRDFKITIFPETMEEVKVAMKFAPAESKDVLFFYLEGRPNLERGDIFDCRMKIDDKSMVKFEAEVEDILPPLLQPPTQEKYDRHLLVLKKYMVQDVIDEVSVKYFKGDAQRSVWTVYYKKLESKPI